MTASAVFDSWAVLAWLRGEAASARVAEFLNHAEAAEMRISMSWINAGEVYYMLARKHGRAMADEFLTRLPSLPLRLELPDRELVIEAARLKAARRLSYADSFAAALARRENAVLVTGDPELHDLHDILAIEWLGLAQ
jgi:ribonuclease VapC